MDLTLSEDIQWWKHQSDRACSKRAAIFAFGAYAALSLRERSQNPSARITPPCPQEMLHSGGCTGLSCGFMSFGA